MDAKREIIIAGNWKMNVLPSEADALVAGLRLAARPARLLVAVFPAAAALSAAAWRIRSSRRAAGTSAAR
ncbi:MAG: triose-phosphate isomerase, partial [Oscillospiraceae bacterium]|nr:triose-phosphate isomerase [Oscillospiraceae bacterium]